MRRMRILAERRIGKSRASFDSNNRATNETGCPLPLSDRLLAANRVNEFTNSQRSFFARFEILQFHSQFTRGAALQSNSTRGFQFLRPLELFVGFGFGERVFDRDAARAQVVD